MIEKQMVGKIWPEDHSLPAPVLMKLLLKCTKSDKRTFMVALYMTVKN